jgi:hypothetical protein
MVAGGKKQALVVPPAPSATAPPASVAAKAPAKKSPASKRGATFWEAAAGSKVAKKITRAKTKSKPKTAPAPAAIKVPPVLLEASVEPTMIITKWSFEITKDEYGHTTEILASALEWK